MVGTGTIEIRAPHYIDNVVLLAEYRLPKKDGVFVKILHGAYKGYYHVNRETIFGSNIRPMRTKAGKTIAMRAVPLEKMERVK